MLGTNFNSMHLDQLLNRNGPPADNLSQIVPSIAAGTHFSNAAPIGFGTFDRSLRYTFVNPALASLNGLSQAYHLGKRTDEIAPPEVAANLDPLLIQVLKDGRSFTDLEFEAFPRNDPSTKHSYLINLFPLIEDGEIFGAGVTVMDVTAFRKLLSEKNALHEELERERVKSQLVFDQLPAGIVIVEGKTGKILYINSSYEKLLGHPPLWSEGIANYKLYGAVHPDGRSYAATDYPVARALTSGEVVQDEEMLYRRGDGKTSHLLVSAAPIRDNQGSVIYAVSVFSDNERNILARNEAEAQTKLREMFAASITHDLRNPLFAAKMASQFALKNPGNVQAVQRQLQRSIAALDRCDKMISDLLDASRLRAGQDLPMNFTPGELNLLIEGFIEDLRPRFDDRLVLITEKSRILGLWWSEGLQRVLENLVLNAFKYGQNDTLVTVTVGSKNTTASFSVHNHGRAISPENISGLFDLYNRLDHAGNRGADGWGIGLTLVKGIVNSLGGHVSVESKEGSGTTFTVELPIQPTVGANK